MFRAGAELAGSSWSPDTQIGHPDEQLTAVEFQETTAHIRFNCRSTFRAAVIALHRSRQCDWNGQANAIAIASSETFRRANMRPIACRSLALISGLLVSLSLVGSFRCDKPAVWRNAAGRVASDVGVIGSARVEGRARWISRLRRSWGRWCLIGWWCWITMGGFSRNWRRSGRMMWRSSDGNLCCARA